MTKECLTPINMKAALGGFISINKGKGRGRNSLPFLNLAFSVFLHVLLIQQNHKNNYSMSTGF